MLSTFLVNRPASPIFYTFSLHDALPICCCIASLRHNLPRLGRRGVINISGARARGFVILAGGFASGVVQLARPGARDRKSTRLNSSHVAISYAVFCLKKKKHIVLLYQSS